MASSELAALVIDCQSEDLEKATTFWSQAFNLTPKPDSEPGHRYRQLTGGKLEVLLQRVEWPSSYHIDIEADDVDAEATRLEGLGAVKKRRVKSWWVMRAPTGHDFCVVPRNAD